MNRQESGEDRYILGYSEEVMDMRNWRSAESCAAHLLPHLEAGFRILDFGCGNGSISMGLAKAVAPGELHGIDREESVIELARSAAAAGGYANANFHVGELTELPFEDNFFDAAHCHTVMLYVPDTQAALAEIKRVLKPGGILSCRERISASSFSSPTRRIHGLCWSECSLPAVLTRRWAKNLKEPSTKPASRISGLPLLSTFRLPRRIGCIR